MAGVGSRPRAPTAWWPTTWAPRSNSTTRTAGRRGRPSSTPTGACARAGAGPRTAPFRYQGQYEDPETGLYYNRFRYYDPEAGSYISQDPIRLAGGSKLYGYVKDTNEWVNPFGLACGEATIRQFENGHAEGHYTVEITEGENALHTHQVIFSRGDQSQTTIIKATEMGQPVHVHTFDVPDATAAMNHQKSLMMTDERIIDLGQYNAISNSCLSHVADVVNAGGGAMSKTQLGYAKFLSRSGFRRLK